MEAKYEYKKGLWTEEEDRILLDYVRAHGKGHWNRIPKLVTELKRSGKSCRMRWVNHLSPNVKRGHFSDQEEDLIIRLHNLLGNRWSLIAGRVPGRTDNQVKNYWNTHLCRKLDIKKQTPAASTGLLKSKSKTTHNHHHHHHNSAAQVDSNPKHSDQSCGSGSTSACTTVKAMEVDVKNDGNPMSTVHVGDDSYHDEDIQWMTNHCADDSLSLSTHRSILSGWGMVQVLDGYPLDLL